MLDNGWTQTQETWGARRPRSMENPVCQRKLHVRVPTNYTGKDESWEDYLKHFQALWNRWEADDMAEGLYIALQGSASNYVYNQPGSETASFEELCAVLDNRYGAAKSVAMDKRKLKERKKEKGESYLSEQAKLTQIWWK